MVRYLNMTGTKQVVKYQVAARVKVARMGVGMTKRELAEAVGVNERTIWNWEHGHRSPVGFRLRELARVTGKPIAFFTWQEKA